MSLTFAETASGTPAALRADSQGRLDASWNYTLVNDSGPVHTGPCVVAGITPMSIVSSVSFSIWDGTPPTDQVLIDVNIAPAQNGLFIQPFPPGGARLQNGLYVELIGTGSVLIWWRRG